MFVLTGAEDELEAGADDAAWETALLTTGAGAEVVGCSTGAGDALDDATGAGKDTRVDDAGTTGALGE